MLTDAYLNQLNIRDVVRMADRYPEAMEYVVARMREPAPQYPPHGECRGFIAAELDGQSVCAELLSTGKHCRSYGVRIGGQVVGVMGMDRVWREHVSPAIVRLGSIRHFEGS